jgi:hypothetical protein
MTTWFDVGFVLKCSYVVPLANALQEEKWSLVQPLLSSSYIGYGTSSLKEDAIEIEKLINYLIYEEQSEGVVLVGHSTGCQDIVHYLRTGGHCSRAVRGAILQVLYFCMAFFFTFVSKLSLLRSLLVKDCLKFNHVTGCMCYPHGGRPLEIVKTYLIFGEVMDNQTNHL